MLFITKEKASETKKDLKWICSEDVGGLPITPNLNILCSGSPMVQKSLKFSSVGPVYCYAFHFKGISVSIKDELNAIMRG